MVFSAQRFILLLFTLQLVFACSFGESKTKRNTKQKALVFDPHFEPISKKYKEALKTTISDFFQHQLDISTLHGMVLIAKNGEILFENYSGKANEEKNIDFGPKTPVHVASISKTITATAVLRLVDDGKIDLDANVRRYIKGFPYSGITIRTLLNHRSGLPYYGYFPEKLTGKNTVMTNRSLLRILKRFKPQLNFPPDTKFAYCNTNYAMLALVIEKVTKKTFPEAMQDLIFQPLKMKNSFIATYEIYTSMVAQSYSSRGELQAFTELDPVYGDKNVYTTVRDLLRFDKGTYCTNFLSKRMQKEMFKGYSYENPGTANYGLGIRIREMEGRTPYYFHTGWWHGNTGSFVSMRKDSTCMIMLSNHYTRKVYAIKSLSSAFGNYPYDYQKENRRR